ncbi:beta 1-4 rhamnosyltransferase Cps2T [Cohnella fermenti]|uniref:Glycosyltransferase family 1 protein n=1 Tax=Cohnella fermenti TaxID=2565925 RepID=A0A4S4BJT4_9BACL|nr:DUF1972 domain-containing protein [Cohnella fermenti]THF74700.1 glycosyltransferase family 1 protein [Cohnella fermenti]
MRHIFILGSKGIPARYGGFETFVDQLTARRRSPELRYHVACLDTKNRETEHNGARCFHVAVPKIGPARAVLYDVLALRRTIRYIRKNGLTDCAIYLLACRIGPFLPLCKRQLEKLGVPLCVNPDGQEWKRSKWNAAIKRYWKLSERLTIKHADRVICDSRAIEGFIREEYSAYRPVTEYISYGADRTPSRLPDDADSLLLWMNLHRLKRSGFYLMVGRFVPENNYELVIREFMQSSSKRDLVIISNVEHNSFYEAIRKRTGFESDPRIKFVGTVYDQELLKKIRETAYGYIHGHEVGGTNPSLLEALAATKVNLLLKVVFNLEVGGDGAVYFKANEGSLRNLIHGMDAMNESFVHYLQHKAKQRIADEYDWDSIVHQYEQYFHQPFTENAKEKEASLLERNFAGRRKRDEAVPADEVRVEATAADLR